MGSKCAWLYRTNGDTVFAYHNEDSSHLTPINHFSAKGHEFVIIPQGRVNGDEYNETMRWAEQQENILTDMCDLLDEDNISKLNSSREVKLIGLDVMDDDVAW